jgi:hypothetical protein
MLTRIANVTLSRFCGDFKTPALAVRRYDARFSVSNPLSIDWDLTGYRVKAS